MTDIDKAIEEAKADMLPFESWERLSGELLWHLLLSVLTGIAGLNVLSARLWTVL